MNANQKPIALMGGVVVTALLASSCKTESEPETTVRALPVSSQSAASETDKPEAVAAAFYQALKDAKFAHAQALFSKYTARHFEVDEAEAVKAQERLLFAGTKTADYKLVGQRELEPGVVAVDVWVKNQTEAKPAEVTDQTLVLREEDGSWRINYASLISYHELDVPGHTKNGVSVRLTMIERYLDHTKFYFDVNNENTRDTVHWSFPGERTLRAKYADDQEAAVEGAFAEFGPGERRTVWIKLDGYRKDLPSRVVTERWARGLGTRGALPGGTRWAYEFELGSGRSSGGDRAP